MKNSLSASCRSAGRSQAVNDLTKKFHQNPLGRPSASGDTPCGAGGDDPARPALREQGGMSTGARDASRACHSVRTEGRPDTRRTPFGSFRPEVSLR